MNDDEVRDRQDERSFAAERAARRRRATERERAADEPFDHPYPERRAGIRVPRRMSEAQAAADMPPGLLGGYGTTGGGQPGAAHPPAGAASAEPGGDDEGPVYRSGR